MRAPTEQEADVLVVGGGAAGLMAAIEAGRRGRGRVVVLEGASRLGAKILISGGGRCNVTNRHVAPADFNGGPRRVIARVLRSFPSTATVGFFAALGVGLHEEARGKLFPDSNRARTVLDALVEAVRAAGALIQSGTRVGSVQRVGDRFEVHTTAATWHARRVVLATGGLSVPRTGSDGHGLTIARSLGHTIVPTTPALVPLLVAEGGPHESLAGVSHEVVLDVRVDESVMARLRGPMLWTHHGVSGPAALDASRHWHRGVLEGKAVALTMNACGGEPFDAIDGVLVERSAGRLTVRAAAERWMPASMAVALVASAGVDPATPLAQLARDDRRRVVHALTSFRLAVTGSRGYGHAEATAGGVPLDEIDPATMASRRCPGLYLAGELLDVDGRLGGFNFQWAWSSGYVAGRGAATEYPRAAQD